MIEAQVKVKNVSKKFCYDFKRSLRYGVRDLGNELLGRQSKDKNKLRADEFWAINDISFELKRGECLGLIGLNGAGKSTLLKMLNGLIKPDTGQISTRGRVGALIELGAGFHPILTGQENIYINGSILGFSKKEIDQKLDEIINFAELEEFIDTPVQNYSSGMKVRLGFAIAAQLKPDILLIDEVLSVGDIGFRAKCYNIISERLRESAIIFVSHSMPEITRICSSILLLKRGKCKYIGNNISKAIEKYYHFHKGPIGREIKSNVGEFTRISFVTSRYDKIPTINFSENLTVKITAKIHQTLKMPVFHMAILNLGLQNICHCSSAYSKTNIANNGEEIELLVTIKKLALRPGLYYVDFAITDQDNIKIIARTHLCHQLQITGTMFGYGETLAVAEWVQTSTKKGLQ